MNDECIQEYEDDKPTIACGCVGCWPESQNLTGEEEVKWLRKRNAWLEEVVGLAVEFNHIDLSDEGWPRWGGEEE